ncbi:hypothetical protein FHS32_003896 [Streptomyces albaduncus]|uniref:Uncharacterized protein n=1 Tax=Streptomyces griseoloalbus TaxID=67303 RepID=A0A7W8BT28_9ACTN|nr:hypothetical protein [Streptomyces albaduncus]
MGGECGGGCAPGVIPGSPCGGATAVGGGGGGPGPALRRGPPPGAWGRSPGLRRWAGRPAAAGAACGGSTPLPPCARVTGARDGWRGARAGVRRTGPAGRGRGPKDGAGARRTGARARRTEHSPGEGAALPGGGPPAPSGTVERDAPDDTPTRPARDHNSPDAAQGHGRPWSEPPPTTPRPARREPQLTRRGSGTRPAPSTVRAAGSRRPSASVGDVPGVRGAAPGGRPTRPGSPAPIRTRRPPLGRGRAGRAW